MAGVRGMSRVAGKALDGIDHLYQSIQDILTTPVGSRIMRRDYGSKLFSLVDRPAEPGIDIEIKAAVAEALDRWEPRFRLTFVKVTVAEAGQMILDLRGVYLPDGKEITLEGVVA